MLLLRIVGAVALWFVLLAAGAIALAALGIHFAGRAGAFLPSGWYGLWIFISAWLSWWVLFKLLSHSGTEKAAETGR